MTGSEGDDILQGEAANDTLNGGVDNDNLDGGPGTDTLEGRRRRRRPDRPSRRSDRRHPQRRGGHRHVCETWVAGPPRLQRRPRGLQPVGPRTRHDCARRSQIATFLHIHAWRRAGWRSVGDVIVGVPTETKEGEHRVALTPDGVRELVAHGHRVLVEAGAGVGSSIPDEEYAAAGATIVDCRRRLGGRDGREGQGAPARRVAPPAARPRPVHLPAPGRLPGGGRRPARRRDHRPGLRDRAARRAAALPLAGAHERGGRPDGAPDRRPLPGAPTTAAAGVLLGGAPGVRPARVVVLGAGNVGWNAAWIAQGMEAEVLLLDKNLDRLRVSTRSTRAGS